MRPYNLIPIRFGDEDGIPHPSRVSAVGEFNVTGIDRDEFPRYHGNAPLVTWTSKTTDADSFKRAARKAAKRGLRLLSYHFSGEKFVAQFGA